MEEIKDDRWGCWISLKELARLKRIDGLVMELMKFNDEIFSWEDLTASKLDKLEELFEQLGNLQKENAVYFRRRARGSRK